MEKLESIPELAGHSIGADIMVPGGEQMARDVVAQRYNANRNIMGRVHAKPIFDTRMY